MASVDSRQKVLIEGPLRHKQQPSIGIVRWKKRHVVFRVSAAGRLEFLICKETTSVPGPVTEVKSIPIEEFGGLITNTKLDGEKYTFAVVSTEVTDCFATDTPDEHTAWTSTIREYLGKELVLNVTIPSRQQMLRSGRAQLRIRNTGFTITTCDNPPRCQGTWQFIHIKQFGGEGTFKFLTGSKCPTGKYLYKLQVEDMASIKRLFTDLSQHKPIFPDDRVGRQMLECSRHMHRGSGSADTADPTRAHSPPSLNPVYSNVPTLPAAARDMAGLTGSLQNVSFQLENPNNHEYNTSNEYQNISSNTTSTSTKGRRSPHVQGFITGEREQGVAATSDGRFNLSPPAALRRLRPSLLHATCMHASTDSEEQSLEDSLTRRVLIPASTPPPDDEHGNGFFNAHPDDRRQALATTSKQGDDVDEVDGAQVGESGGPGTPNSSGASPHHLHHMAADRLQQHGYANVDLSRLFVRGAHSSKGRKASVEILPGAINVWNRDTGSVPTSPQKHLPRGGSTEELSESDHHNHHVLALAQSTEELESSELTDGSCCSPDLVLPPPMRFPGPQKAPSGLDSSGSSSPEEQFVSNAKQPKLSLDVYSSVDHLDREVDMVDAEQFNSDSEVEVRKKVRSRYDCLEIQSPLLKSAQVDNHGKPVSPPQGAIYDSLVPLEDSGRRSASPTITITTTTTNSSRLAPPRKLSGPATLAHPQTNELLNTYRRRMLVTGRVHTYEMVDFGSDEVDLPPQVQHPHQDGPEHAQKMHRHPAYCNEVIIVANPSGNTTTNKQQPSATRCVKSPGNAAESCTGQGQQERKERGTHEDVVILAKGHAPPADEVVPLAASLSGYSNVTLPVAQQGCMSANTTLLPALPPKPKPKPNCAEDKPQEQQEEELMGTYVYAGSNGSTKPDFSLTLPSASIIFNTPPVPPKPKILAHQPSRDRFYVQLDLPPQNPTTTTRPTPTNAAVPVSTSHHNNVTYTTIDLSSTEQLATMRKERQEEKAERQRTVRVKVT